MKNHWFCKLVLKNNLILYALCDSANVDFPLFFQCFRCRRGPIKLACFLKKAYKTNGFSSFLVAKSFKKFRKIKKIKKSSSPILLLVLPNLEFRIWNPESLESRIEIRNSDSPPQSSSSSSQISNRDSEFGIPDSEFGVRESRFEIRDSRFEILDFRF